MVTIRKYAKNISQSSGTFIPGRNPKIYRQFTNLNALKNDDGTYASCDNIGGKNGTWPRPSTLYFRDFGFNIPSYAKIKKIVIGYGHNKISYSRNSYPSINAPLITLTNVSGCSERGYAVPVNYARFTKTYNVSPSPNQVNSYNFGVNLDYPINANTNPGGMKVGYVWIEITYDDLKFSINSNIVKSKEKYYVDDLVEVQLNLANLSQARIDYDASVNITLPAGVEYDSKVGGNGSLTKNNASNIVWVSNMGSNYKSSVILRFKCTSIGNKTITFTESSTGIITRLTLKVEEDQLKIMVDSPDYGVEDEKFLLKLTAKTNAPQTDAGLIYFHLPEELNIDSFFNPSATLNFFVNDDGLEVWEWEPQLGNTTVDECNIYVTAVQPGTFTYYINTSPNFTENNAYTIKIKPKNLTLPFLSKIVVNDEIRGRMEHGIKYTLVSFMKIVLENTAVELDDYAYNFKMGFFNGPIPENEADFTEEYMLANSIFSDSTIEPNTLTKKSLEFVFDENNPLILIFTGEYLELNHVENVSVEFTDPILAETVFYTGIEEPGLFPTPLKSLIENEEFAVTELESLKETNRIRIYDYQMGGLETRDNIVIQGLKVNFTVNTNNDCSLLLKVITPNGAVGERSININEGTEEISIGGKFDLFGLNFEDYQDLDYLELELVELNPFHHDTYLEINNVYLSFYYMTLPDYNIRAYVNGVDCRYYNMFITNVQIPAATDNNVKYIDVDGTDSNIAYRSNIKGKEIKIEFSVLGCDLEETSLFLERIGNLFRNKRNEFNKPKLNTVEFSHYPGRVWDFILEDAIEADIEISDYSGDIKLVVPSGTSRSKEALITNAQGTNQGIGKVTPIVQVIPLSDTVTITETVTGQNMIIRDENLSAAEVIIIDCENRSVQKVVKAEDGKLNYTDITNKIDFNSKWFLLEGEYRFSGGESANIQAVKFYERW